jgi:hypothetical protein
MSQKGNGIISGLLSTFGLGKKRRRRTRKPKIQGGKGIFDTINDIAKATKAGSTLAGFIPGVGGIASSLLRSAGYGKKKKRSGRGKKKAIGL